MDLSFLGNGSFKATLWSDGEAPTDVRRETRTIDGDGASLQLALAGGGGAAIRLTPGSED